MDEKSEAFEKSRLADKIASATARKSKKMDEDESEGEEAEADEDMEQVRMILPARILLFMAST